MYRLQGELLMQARRGKTYEAEERYIKLSILPVASRRSHWNCELP
jgi:hypothetical protein